MPIYRNIWPALLVLAVQAVAPASTVAQGGAKPTREARVLDLLRRLPARNIHLSATRLAESKNAHGCTVIAPAARGSCGFGWRQSFDPDRARRMARELCAIYGLQVTANVAAPAGVVARLDCLDVTRGIALKLRGRVRPRFLSLGGADEGNWPIVVDERPKTDLDALEHQALRTAKFRVHTADVSAFWVAASGDQFTSTLAYLRSVTCFLNEVTDGEDVDLTAIGGPCVQTIPVPQPPARSTYTVSPWSGGGGFTLEVEAETEVELRINPSAACRLDSGKLVAPLGNDKHPTLLQWFSFGFGQSGIRLALRQPASKAETEDLATSKNGLLILPSCFDSTKPFLLVLQMQPGSYRFGRSLWITTAGMEH